MNKAILVVICDFIVLSMMTIILGLTGPRSNIGGTADPDARVVSALAEQLAERNAELEAARKQLSELRRHRPLSDAETAELARLTEELAKLRLEMEETRVGSLPENRRGELPPDELAKQLREAKLKLAALELTAADAEEGAAHLQKVAAEEKAVRVSAEAELARTREKNVELASELTESERERIAAQKELVEAREQLQSASGELAQRRDELAETSGKLAESERERRLVAEELAGEKRRSETAQADLAAQIATLNRAKDELARQQEELARTRAELADSRLATAGQTDEARHAQMQLAFTSGKLATTEKELAETRGNLERLRRAATEREIQLSDARRQVSGLQNVLKKAVADLSSAQQEVKSLQGKAEELSEARERMAVLQGQLDTGKAQLQSAQEQLAKAEQGLKSNVMDFYEKAVRTLVFTVSDRRALADHVGEHTFYLPELEIGGKRYLAGELLSMVDMASTNTPYSRVYDLQYAVSPAVGGDLILCHPEKLRSADFDPRVVFMEVNSSSSSPLKILTASELKKQGTKELYLFKKESMGGESAILNERASIDLSAASPVLIVRNSSSRSSELKADIGDYVLTRNGELAGVVVSVERQPFNNRQEAKAAVFPDNFAVEDSVAIELVKRPGEEYCTDFIEKTSALFKAAKKLK